MSQERRLASFCRLCLTKTEEKVPIFGKEEANVINLLMLIELDIDPEQEYDGCVCFDCIVTLEGFFQFKEQCHENDEYIRTHPPEVGASPNAERTRMECDYLDSEEEGLVEDYYPFQESAPKRKIPVENLNRQAASVECSKQGNSVRTPAKRNSDTQVLDPDEVERDCAKLNIAKRNLEGPTVADLQVLRDSYPDYFYFEKSPRSLYFTLVYYGERYHSATYSERYTYYKCVYRRRHNCKASVVAWNDYSQFERRYEHSHGELDDREPLKEYTPRQALPEIFKICRQSLALKQVQRRRTLVERKKMQLQLDADEGGQLVDELKEKGDQDALTKVLHKSGILDEGSDEED